MVKNLRTKLKKLRKGEANVGLIMLAFGAILAVAMYLYAKNAGSGVSDTTAAANTGIGEMNNKLGTKAEQIIPSMGEKGK